MNIRVDMNYCNFSLVLVFINQFIKKPSCELMAFRLFIKNYIPAKNWLPI